jgi:hypothetical protein
MCKGLSWRPASSKLVDLELISVKFARLIKLNDMLKCMETVAKQGQLLIRWSEFLMSKELLV